MGRNINYPAPLLLAHSIKAKLSPTQGNLRKKGPLTPPSHPSPNPDAGMKSCRVTQKHVCDMGNRFEPTGQQLLAQPDQEWFCNRDSSCCLHPRWRLKWPYTVPNQSARQVHGRNTPTVAPALMVAFLGLFHALAQRGAAGVWLCHWRQRRSIMHNGACRWPGCG